MNLYSILSSFIIWTIGGLLAYHTIKRWNDSNKQNHKYSEITQVALFFIMGIYILFLVQSNEATENYYYQILFYTFFSLIILFPVFNVLPNYLKHKRNPDFRKEETYEKFLHKLNTKYESQEIAEKADKTKDFSRKLLHLLQFSAYVILHQYIINNQEEITQMGLKPFEYRNFFLFLIGGFFWIMMMTGDLVRMENWRILPKWAKIWFSKSLEPEREAWTINSATSILLANFVFLHPVFQPAIFFSAAFISCIGDAFASVIGKKFGEHKLIKVGKFPNKTIEGLIAGALISMIGVIILFYIYPIGQPDYLNFIFGIIAFISFIIIDLYVVKIADNIMNSLVPGLIFSFIINFL